MRRFWRRLRWITHPITIFVALQIVWLAITLIWVIWFVGEQAEIAALARRFGQEYFSSKIAVAMLVIGCVLLGVLLVGLILLFVVSQKQSSAARQQRTFVSSVTHELKSPLASLQLAFETLSLHQLDEAMRTRMNGMIQTDIDRLKRLIDQILVAGRLDRGLAGAEDDGASIDIGDLIGRICERLTYLDAKLHSRLVVNCPPNVMIQAPRAALTLIFNNLIENAIKYSPLTAPIQVEVERAEDHVLISIADQGLGLDKQDKHRIFKMFRRGDAALKKAIPGTGLGLFIVRSSVRMLGGKVWAQSQGRNLGSTFYVSLPATDQYARPRKS